MLAEVFAEEQTAPQREEVVVPLYWKKYEYYGWQMVNEDASGHHILAEWSPRPPEGLLCRFKVTRRIGNRIFLEWIGFRKATSEEVAKARRSS